MAEAGQPSEGMFNRSVWTGTSTKVALSGTTAKTSALTAGKLYVFTADTAWFFNQGAQATVAATTSDLPLAAYEKILVWVTAAGTDDGVAGILTSGTGNMFYKPMVG